MEGAAADLRAIRDLIDRQFASMSWTERPALTRPRSAVTSSRTHRSIHPPGPFQQNRSMNSHTAWAN